MKILVDIGNSRIKWCVEYNGKIGTGYAIEYKRNQFIEQIEHDWLRQSLPDSVVISSVGEKEITSQLLELAKKIWPNIKAVFAKSSSFAFAVHNAYQQAEVLGVDRWLGLIALHHYYPGKSCLVDCGTAITLDCLDETGLHLGGLICPGLQLMRESLFLETSALPCSSQHYPLTLANSTEPAIYNGTLLAATGLIEKSVNDLCDCEKLVLTGGDAELVAENLALESIIEPDFVLKGLSLYGKGENQS